MTAELQCGGPQSVCVKVVPILRNDAEFRIVHAEFRIVRKNLRTAEKYPLLVFSVNFFKTAELLRCSKTTQLNLRTLNAEKERNLRTFEVRVYNHTLGFLSTRPYAYYYGGSYLIERLLFIRVF